MNSTHVCLVVLGFVTAGCDKTKEASKTAQNTEQRCDPRIPGNGRTQRVPDPVPPTTCYVIVLSRNYCEYDGSGQFRANGTEASGVCLVKSTP